MLKAILSVLCLATVALAMPQGYEEPAPAEAPYAAPPAPVYEAPGVYRPPGFPYSYGVYPYGGYYGGFYPGYPFYPGYYSHAPYYGAVPYSGGIPHAAYIGQFSGTCDGAKNGLYYVDQYSFAYCSNGFKSITNCPDGTENPTVDKFNPGDYGVSTTFCSINQLSH